MNKFKQVLAKIAWIAIAAFLFYNLVFILLWYMIDVVIEFFTYILLWNALGYIVLKRLFINDLANVRKFFMVSILVLMNILFFSILGHYVSHFNSFIWKNHESIRYYMIDNINKDINLIKMSESQVIQLFGEPYTRSNNKYVYRIGNEWPQPTYYVIELSENHTVIDAYTTQHWN